MNKKLKQIDNSVNVTAKFNDWASLKYNYESTLRRSVHKLKPSGLFTYRELSDIDNMVVRYLRHKDVIELFNVDVRIDIYFN